uniref:arrestin domain-containing protein 3-like n=1 Tax=Oncorhynchus gorbuscha TaxID=8017 RepID=UPI001EAF3105
MVLGKVKTLAVYFDYLNDNNVPVYSGGDSVSGRVIIEVIGEVHVKTLNITAGGVAKVRWTESRNAGANTAYTQNYTEEVEYLNHSDTLIGEEREAVQPDLKLAEGRGRVGGTPAAQDRRETPAAQDRRETPAAQDR